MPKERLRLHPQRGRHKPRAWPARVHHLRLRCTYLRRPHLLPFSGTWKPQLRLRFLNTDESYGASFLEHPVQRSTWMQQWFVILLQYYTNCGSIDYEGISKNIRNQIYNIIGLLFYVAGSGYSERTGMNLTLMKIKHELKWRLLSGILATPLHCIFSLKVTDRRQLSVDR